MQQSSQAQRTSLWVYVPVILLGAFLIGAVFHQNFKTGEEVGLTTPPSEDGKKHVAPVADLRALAKNADLATKGKGLYQINCASCHGASGMGDGPRSAGLNPPPRKYPTEQFKYGNDIHSIYETLTKGSPGTSMPSFGLLPEEDRMAMAHFVRTMVPSPTVTTDEIVNKFPEVPAGAVVEGGTASSAPMQSDSGRIPIQFAMQQVATAQPNAVVKTSLNESLPGSKIYAQRCSSCHGARGEGAVSEYLSVAPYRYNMNSSLAKPSAAWFNNSDKFAEIIINGLPGRMMPGNGTLTREEINHLHDFVRSLSGM